MINRIEDDWEFVNLPNAMGNEEGNPMNPPAPIEEEAPAESTGYFPCTLQQFIYAQFRYCLSENR